MEEKVLFNTVDGLELYGLVNLPENPKAVAVIVHGGMEHLNRYDALSEFLLANDFATVRYDQRGHGRSPGKSGLRAYVENFNEFPDDVKTVVDFVKSKFVSLPVFVIGHSIGGFSVVAFGTKYPGEVAGIVTSGALTRLNNSTLVDLPEGTPPETYFDNAIGGAVCSDPQVVEDYNNDPLVEKQFTAGLFQNLAKGVDYLKENAASLVDPILILHGNEDVLVFEKDSRDLYGEIGSTDKKLIIYPKLYHEIFNEPIKEEIYNELTKWMEERL